MEVILIIGFLNCDDVDSSSVLIVRDAGTSNLECAGVSMPKVDGLSGGSNDIYVSPFSVLCLMRCR